MKIVGDPDTTIMTLKEARRNVEGTINNRSTDHVFVIKYDGELISISGEYYKFAWKTLYNVQAALTNKFGRDLSHALVEAGVIEIVKVYI